MFNFLRLWNIRYYNYKGETPAPCILRDFKHAYWSILLALSTGYSQGSLLIESPGTVKQKQLFVV